MRTRRIQYTVPHLCIPEPNYFSRLFRTEYGMSPSQYRSMTT
ncbi:MAG: AraC family transcriptional regulator [Solobacterium sp.]|nr:AraC family transcriptional regulator [Solobacterium sp.]